MLFRWDVRRRLKLIQRLDNWGIFFLFISNHLSLCQSKNSKIPKIRTTILNILVRSTESVVTRTQKCIDVILQATIWDIQFDHKVHLFFKLDYSLNFPRNLTLQVRKYIFYDSSKYVLGWCLFWVFPNYLAYRGSFGSK